MVPWGTDSSSRGGIVHISLRFYLAFTLGVLVTAVASAKLQIPDIPPGHPRVYLRLADVADIKTKILLPEFQDRWSSLLYYSQTDAAAAAASGLTSCAGASDTVDVWHYYKPAEDSEVTISLCGSAFDTTLAVYDSCGKTMLQCNDDSDACGAYSMQSSLTMALKADRTYYIRVAGYDGVTGDYIITVFGGRGTVGIAADFDNSGDVDLYDLAFIFEQWLAEGPARHPDTGKSPDLRYDGTINFGDFSIFALSRLEQ